MEEKGEEEGFGFSHLETTTTTMECYRRGRRRNKLQWRNWAGPSHLAHYRGSSSAMDADALNNFSVFFVNTLFLSIFFFNLHDFII